MGTVAWKNWVAFNDGNPLIETYEDELHSDVSFFGGPISFGPHRLSTVLRRNTQAHVGPAIIVEGDLHADLIPEVVVDGELAPSDSKGYHGGTIGDEIAALISLELGVRIRFAGMRRSTGIQGSGLPPFYMDVPRLARPGQPDREVLPHVVSRSTDLSGVSLLGSLPALDEDLQVELVRAARAYSQGIWWANEDPNQAWLQLVTAVEIAAGFRQKVADEPSALIEELWPELWTAIEPAEDSVRKKVSKLLAPQVRATRKFIDFLEKYSPARPDPEPQFDKLDWRQMRKHAQVVYRHRSKALHDGKPFPMPMLEVPRIDESGVLQETPSGLSAGGLGGVWLAEETPMLLSTFEYIVRGSLLRWWEEQAALTV
ncbi:hypothetical protein ACNJ7E_04715 [Rhodococcus sp. NM-2]|uniref:hypothetical protein n=1 Tax=Rhodococcus sp. NM-2 TaxID=3401174 RepID=UPI003AB030A7